MFIHAAYLYDFSHEQENLMHFESQVNYSLAK